ncbi:MAG: hypothetical protein ABFD24_12410 [Anaerolineaceae bacterium]
MIERKSQNRRRIFIRAKDKVCQIFSFKQSADGSIYCSSSDFDDANWFSAVLTEIGPQLVTTEPVGEGKISFHGSGMVAIRPNDDPKGHRLIIKGNNLFNKMEEKVGIRHLFTIFSKEPKYQPTSSPIFNRDGDYCIEANEELKPFVLVFFAAPQGLSISFQFNLHMDDMINIPNDFLGLNGFSLRYHDILWFAYRTNHMEKWPKQAQVVYHDGYSFPIFIGTGLGIGRWEFRQPLYSLNGNNLEIICNRNYSDDYSNP